eukprot:1152622-Pelagomonas_calceolata.AAC.9
MGAPDRAAWAAAPSKPYPCMGADIRWSSEPQGGRIAIRQPGLLHHQNSRPALGQLHTAWAVAPSQLYALNKECRCALACPAGGKASWCSDSPAIKALKCRRAVAVVMSPSGISSHPSSFSADTDGQGHPRAPDQPAGASASSVD